MLGKTTARGVAHLDVEHGDAWICDAEVHQRVDHDLDGILGDNVLPPEVDHCATQAV